MSYQEDVALVLRAMGWAPVALGHVRAWVPPGLILSNFQFPLADDDIDANFIVERVIPEFFARGLRVRIDYRTDGAIVVEVFDRAASEDVIVGYILSTNPTMPEAVMAAIAAALRAEQ